MLNGSVVPYACVGGVDDNLDGSVDDYLDGGVDDNLDGSAEDNLDDSVDDNLDGSVVPGVGAGGADADLCYRAGVLLTVWA